MDDRCAACGSERGFLFVCSECEFSFCKEHANPSLHRCPELESDAEASRTASEEFEHAEDRTGRDSNESESGRSSGGRGSIAEVVRRVRGSVRSACTSASAGLERRARSLPRAASGFPFPDGSSPHARLRSSLLGPVRTVSGRTGPANRAASRQLAATLDSTASRIRDVGTSGTRLRRLVSVHKITETAGSRTSSAIGEAADRLRDAPGGIWSPEWPSRRITIAVALLFVFAFSFSAAGGASQTMATFESLGNSANDAVVSETNGPGDGELEPTALETATFEEVNAAREDADVAPLEYEDNLSTVAAYHSDDMAARGYAGLESPVGENVTDRFDRFGHSCVQAGQMMLWVDGANSTGERDLAEAIVDQWLASEEHATFLRNDGYERGAVGVAVSDSGRVYVSLATCGSRSE